MARQRLTHDERDNRRFDNSERRRATLERRAVERIDRQLDACDRMIGELCRNGAPVFYVWPQGGRYREGTRADLTDFLIRNRYV